MCIWGHLELFVASYGLKRFFVWLIELFFFSWTKSLIMNDYDINTSTLRHNVYISQFRVKSIVTFGKVDLCFLSSISPDSDITPKTIQPQPLSWFRSLQLSCMPTSLEYLLSSHRSTAVLQGSRSSFLSKISTNIFQAIHICHGG